jgi:hypothetical protein
MVNVQETFDAHIVLWTYIYLLTDTSPDVFLEKNFDYLDNGLLKNVSTHDNVLWMNDETHDNDHGKVICSDLLNIFWTLCIGPVANAHENPYIRHSLDSVFLWIEIDILSLSEIVSVFPFALLLSGIYGVLALWSGVLPLVKAMETLL